MKVRKTILPIKDLYIKLFITTLEFFNAKKTQELGFTEVPFITAFLALVLVFHYTKCCTFSVNKVRTTQQSLTLETCQQLEVHLSKAAEAELLSEEGF